MQITKFHAMNFQKDTQKCSQNIIKCYHRDFQHQTVQLGKPYILILKQAFVIQETSALTVVRLVKAYCLCRTQYLSAGPAPAAFLKQYSKSKNRLVN